MGRGNEPIIPAARCRVLAAASVTRVAYNGCMTRTIRLSKSKIMSGLQCSRRLWFDVHRPGLAIYDAGTLQGFAGGHQVGTVARGLYPGGTLVEAQRNLSQAVRLTAALLAGSRDAVVYEGAFRHADVLVRADVVARTGGRLRLTEVKSATRLKPYHVDDAAVQAWVAGGAGYRADAVCVAHVDASWVYPGGGDYQGLLREVDVTAEVRERAAGLPRVVRGLQLAVAGPAPLRPAGPHCRDPFACPYLSLCEPATALAAGQSPASEHVPAPARPRAPGGARVFLALVTVRPAVPVWPGTRPSERVPVQWSCHFRRASGAALEHAESLACGSQSPHRQVAESLLALLDAPLREAAVVCDLATVQGLLAELARRLPDLASGLQRLAGRLVAAPAAATGAPAGSGESPQQAYFDLLSLTEPALGSALPGMPPSAVGDASQLSLIDIAPSAEPPADVLRRELLAAAARRTLAMAEPGVPR
jgi:hypothetical protein